MKKMLLTIAVLAGIALLLGLSGCCTACAKKPGCASCCGDAKAAEWTAIFNGKDLTGWRNARVPNAENKWSVEDGAMTNSEHGNDIATEKSYQDFEISIEYKTVPGGNSGVYLRGRMEIQVLDSFGKDPVTKQDNGAIYDQFKPRVNASKPAGEWNLLEASIVGNEISATLNGQVIHDHQKFIRVTGGALPGKATGPGPLLLQGDHGKVWYRNIKIRELGAPAAGGACCGVK